MDPDLRLLARINLKLLQTFVIVAEHHSFREASDQTHRSQSAVSTQIRQLESQVGAPLFRRTTRSVHLTAEGEQFLASARLALSELGTGLRRIYETTGLRNGHISLACSPTIAATCLPRILAVFEKEYPTVSITMRELTADDLFESMRQGRADFGIGPLATDKALECEPILDDSLFALVPRKFVATRKATITLTELAAFPLLVSTTSTPARRLIETALHERGLPFTTKYDCHQSQTLIAMAEAGLGAAILPHSVLSLHTAGAAHVLRIVQPTMVRQVAIIRRRGQQLSPASERLAGLVRTLISKTPGRVRPRKQNNGHDISD